MATYRQQHCVRQHRPLGHPNQTLQVKCTQAQNKYRNCQSSATKETKLAVHVKGCMQPSPLSQNQRQSLAIKTPILALAAKTLILVCVPRGKKLGGEPGKGGTPHPRHSDTFTVPGSLGCPPWILKAGLEWLRSVGPSNEALGVPSASHKSAGGAHLPDIHPPGETWGKSGSEVDRTHKR